MDSRAWNDVMPFPSLESDFIAALGRRPYAKALITLVSIILATLVQSILWKPISPHTFVFFFPAVIVSSIFGGFIYGALATIAMAVIGDYFFMEPRWQLGGSPNEMVRMLAFAYNGLLISLTTSYLSRKYQNLANRRLEETLLRMGDGLFVIDENSRYRSLNQRALDIVGLKTEDMLGKSYLDLFPFLRGTSFDLAVQDVLRTRQPVHMDFKSPVADRWFELHFYPAKGSINIYAQEITSRKIAEERLKTVVQEVTEANFELQRLNKELERSNADLAQFAHAASHDMKEPIRMISNYMQLLDKQYGSKLDEEARVYMRFASQGAKRMNALINDVLSYSRVGATKVEEKPAEFAVCIREAIENLRAVIGESKAKINVVNPPGSLAPSKQIVQVFQNLISNGIKFRRPDVSPVIDISVHVEGNDWLVEVSDNGIGIKEGDRALVFQLFKRVHTYNDFPGSGIGLSTVKRIIENHGGKIWIEPSERGTVVRFTLPRPVLPFPQA